MLAANTSIESPSTSVEPVGAEVAADELDALFAADTATKTRIIALNTAVAKYAIITTIESPPNN